MALRTPLSGNGRPRLTLPVAPCSSALRWATRRQTFGSTQYSQDLLLPWVDLLVSRAYVVGDRSVRLGLIEAVG